MSLWRDLLGPESVVSTAIGRFINIAVLRDKVREVNKAYTYEKPTTLEAFGETCWEPKGCENRRARV